MTAFGTIPPEPPRISSLDDVALQFRDAILAVLAEIPDAMVYESLRTDARQAWLYGFGRQYDDGRGIVTHAETADHGWHKFGCAADLIHRTKQWDAGDEWFANLGAVGKANGLTWGGDWQMRDLPHLQWGKCRPAPSQEAMTLYASGGNPAVWYAVGANA